MEPLLDLEKLQQLTMLGSEMATILESSKAVSNQGKLSLGQNVHGKVSEHVCIEDNPIRCHLSHSPGLI